MSKSSKIIVLAILLVAAIGAAVYVIIFDKKETPTNTPQQSTDMNTSKTTEEDKTEPATSPKAEVATTITYSNDGFSPGEITVEANQTIKVINQSSSTLDFSSDPHPTHTNNPELNVGDIVPGESATFTISKAGNWGFHNHYAPSHHGMAVVK